MSKLWSSLQFVVTILALAAAWLIAMRFIWPRLLAFTILFYFLCALVFFVALIIYAVASLGEGRIRYCPKCQSWHRPDLLFCDGLRAP